MPSTFVYISSSAWNVHSFLPYLVNSYSSFQHSAQMPSSGFLQTVSYPIPILCWHHAFTSLTTLYCYLIRCVSPTRLCNLKEQGPSLIHLFYCIILHNVCPQNAHWSSRMKSDNVFYILHAHKLRYKWIHFDMEWKYEWTKTNTS